MNEDSPFVEPGSPFFEKRYEREATHPYFLLRPLFDDLEKPIPTYLIGGRGTGKTTLLQALTWNERVTNDALRKQLRGDSARWRYLGAYLKLPEYQLAALESWLEPAAAPLREAAIGLYIELLWFEVLAEGIAELVIRKVLKATPADEQEAVQSILKAHREVRPGAMDFLSQAECMTLKEFGALIRQNRQVMDAAALWQEDPEVTLRRYPLGQLGELTRTLGPIFGDFCSSHMRGVRADWHFKVCMDEGECLSPLQLRVINTIVRLAKRPIFPVLSFVSWPDDIQATLIRDLTLADADRQLLVLDDDNYMSDAMFQAFAEGVASVRVQSALRDQDAMFRVEERLGRLDINGLLAAILQESSSRDARQLLSRAVALRDSVFFRDAAADGTQEEAVSTPRIYQAYLVDKLGLRLPEPDDPKWDRRRQESAELRKRMVAAYLGICHELGTTPRYASAQMVYQMSDRCIRDFLLLINEVFIHADLPLREFLSRTVSAEVQDAALHKASRKKRDAIKRSPMSAPNEAGRIIHGLAVITHLLQTEGVGNRNLRSPERGEFVIAVPSGMQERYQPLLDLVQDAGEAGFLRVLERGRSTWRVRVHTSLSAEYGFSYRGAQYRVGINLSDLDALRITADADELERLASRIGRRLAGADDSAPLFERGEAQ